MAARIHIKNFKSFRKIRIKFIINDPTIRVNSIIYLEFLFLFQTKHYLKVSKKKKQN